jgi:hypothetical protein
MDHFFEFLKSFFVWADNNFEFLVAIAFVYWLLKGYVRWHRRFDRFTINLLRTIAVMQLLNRAGDNSGAVRLYAELIYSDELFIFTNSERAGFIMLSVELIGCNQDRLIETCNKIADHSGRCYKPLRHLWQRPAEFLKTLFH